MNEQLTSIMKHALACTAWQDAVDPTTSERMRRELGLTQEPWTFEKVRDTFGMAAAGHWLEAERARAAFLEEATGT